MIPLKDNIPTRRFPVITVAIIALNVFAFVFFQHATWHSAGFHVSDKNVARYSLIPYRLTHPGKDCALAGQLASGQVVRSSAAPLCEGAQVPVEDISTGQVGTEVVQRAIPRDDPPAIATIFFGMFMHGGLLHIAGNMLFLWIFGNNVEDSMGRPRFVLFYLLAGVVAALAQVAVGPSSTVPTLGASGAIAGVLGGYALLFPRARVVTVIFIIFFFTLLELPALLVLGGWFLLQLADSALLSHAQGGGVAYFAHIGGFIFGLLTIRLFASGRRADYDPAPRYPVY